MGDNHEHRSSTSSSKDKDRKHHRSSHTSSSSHRDRDSKRHRSSHSSSHHRRARSDDDEEEWVEKPSEGAAAPAATAVTAEAQGPPVDTVGTFSVARGGHSALERVEGLTDGYGDGDVGDSTGGPVDLFSAMGTERARRAPKEKLDPTQMMGQSSRELNKAHWQGVSADNASAPAAPPTPSGPPVPGSSGSSWRMSKLRRTYEMAEEERRPVEEVALERYSTLEEFDAANEEKRVLDERRGGRLGGSSTPRGADGGRKFVFTDNSAGSSRPGSRGSFRRPGEAPGMMTPGGGGGTPRGAGVATPGAGEGSRPGTPVPRVFTPIPVAPRSAMSTSMVLDPDPTTTNDGPILSQSELNRLQAKVLKAKLMGDDKAGELEKKYERERVRALESGGATADNGGQRGEQVQMLPTLDGRGRLYDLGKGGEEEEAATGKRKKKEKAFESHDPKTGELIRHNADDDSTSLAELVRQERFSAGASDQKDMDYEMASRIAGDARYANTLDYADENAEKLARKKMKSEVLKKAFAVQDYAKTKKALDNCNMCFGDEGEAPRSAVVALGTRAYLGLLENDELVPGHCRIVPIQHHFSSLDADDETWDEIKNFMKTLMQCFAEEDKGVVFFESVLSIKNQRHTCIEAIPIPFNLFDTIPIYFQEAIDNSEQEWSQHKKRINFTSERPFRRSLVPNLPYFMVHFDYKGEKGYGHIIEGIDDAPDRDADGEETRGELGEQGGGEFPRWFAQEIIGNMLDLEPRRWRKPRRVDFRQNKDRVAKFRAAYDRFDWTKLLAGARA